MKTSERLLNASKTIWDAYNEHPFVLGIQNGTLERDKFRYYIMQDFLYLKDYAKTYAVGVAKAKSVETANLFAKYINVMNGELDVHKGYMGKFAVTQEEIDAMKPSLDNLSYTSYMVRVAYDESEVEVLAAVLSCAYSYEVIAKKIVANRPRVGRRPVLRRLDPRLRLRRVRRGQCHPDRNARPPVRALYGRAAPAFGGHFHRLLALRDGLLADGVGDETVSEKKRCVIVGGADIGDYARVKQYLRADDAIVFCDSGLKHMEALGVKPALIVGDFDSHCNPHLDVETIVLPCEKDDTDTVFAVKTMVQRGYDDFLLIGVIGARLDHTLGNVSILPYLDSLGKKAEIVDDYSEMQIVSKDEVSIEDKYPFFSLLNITGCARGITIRDAKYPLDGAEITCEYQYGVSNEVLPGKTAKISVRDGKLLLIKICRQ